MAASGEDGVYTLLGKNLKLTSEEDIEPYLQEIRAIDHLKEIHLGGNTLGVGACQALGKLLAEKTRSTLQIADFADIFTGRLISEIPDALRALCDALVDHDALVEMNLSDNAFGGRSAEPMVNFLTHNHHFSVLKLNNNGLGVTGGQIVANALLAAAEELEKLGKESKLRTVICGRNRLEDGSAPYWAKAYAAHKNLEEVRMFQNGIRMDGIVALAQGLASCPNLKVLDFQDNTATVSGSRGIAGSLPSWPELEVLNLSDCLLKPRGGYILLDALHKGNNTKLHTLQLQYCDLDRKALERLGSALDSGALKNVSKLEINGNWADEDDECIEKIKSALEKNGHGDALDELDEMDPEGEDDEEAESDAEEEDAEPVSNEEQHAATTSEQSNPVEIAAAAVAAPAASLAVAAGATANVASNLGDSIDDKLQNFDLGGGGGEPQASKEVAEEHSAATTTDAEQTHELAPEVSMAPAENADQPEQSRPQPLSTASPQVDGSSKETEKVDSALAVGGAALVGAGTASAVGLTSSHKEKSVTTGDSEPSHISEAVIPTPSADEKEAAQNAAEVAESAQEVPEEKEIADIAAEVAESAQEVPDARVAAETADEVDEVAKQVPENATSGQQTPVPVADPAATKDTAVAETAAGGALGLSAVSAASSAGPDSTAVAQSAAATQGLTKQTPETAPAPSRTAAGRHTQQGSVDLSGELYGDESQARSPRVQTQALAPDSIAGSAAAASAETPSAEEAQQKKRGFRAALGAIRELLR